MYRIRTAARLAGLTPEVIRAWERRYGLIEPQRTDSGYRMYSEADVTVLRGAKSLIEAGQSIGDIVRLPREQIASAASVPTQPATPAEAGRNVSERVVKDALHAIAEFDRDGLEVALFPVIGLGAVSPIRACEEVLLPLLAAIGKGWEEGQLSIAAEHFGSAIVRAKILYMLEFQPRPQKAPVVVCACPDGERHEGGLLAFAVHAAGSGYRVVYLGASTPLEQALATVDTVNAHVLALSVTMPDGDAEVDGLVERLASASSTRPNLVIIAGGAAALRRRERFEQAGIAVAPHITQDLRALTPAAARARG